MGSGRPENMQSVPSKNLLEVFSNLLDLAYFLECALEGYSLEACEDERDFQECLQAKINALKEDEAFARFTTCQKLVSRKLQALRHASFGLEKDQGFWVCFWGLIRECFSIMEDFIVSASDGIGKLT